MRLVNVSSGYADVEVDGKVVGFVFRTRPRLWVAVADPDDRPLSDPPSKKMRHRTQRAAAEWVAGEAT
jgi:hypothetical protein